MGIVFSSYMGGDAVAYLATVRRQFSFNRVTGLECTAVFNAIRQQCVSVYDDTHFFSI